MAKKNRVGEATMADDGTPLPEDEDLPEGVEDDGEDGGLSAAEETLPEGFEQVGALQTPYAVKKRGVVIEGELVGRFIRKKPTGKGSPFFYQIRLSRPAVGVTGSKRDKSQREVLVKSGELISLDETNSIADFATYAENIEYGGRYLVYIKFLRKMELPGGNTFWEVRKGAKALSVPKRPESTAVNR